MVGIINIINKEVKIFNLGRIEDNSKEYKSKEYKLNFGPEISELLDSEYQEDIIDNITASKLVFKNNTNDLILTKESQENDLILLNEFLEEWMLSIYNKKLSYKINDIVFPNFKFYLGEFKISYSLQVLFDYTDSTEKKLMIKNFNEDLLPLIEHKLMVFILENKDNEIETIELNLGELNEEEDLEQLKKLTINKLQWD